MRIFWWNKTDSRIFNTLPLAFIYIILSIRSWYKCKFYFDLACVNTMNWNEMCFRVALIFSTSLLSCFAYVFRIFRFLLFFRAQCFISNFKTSSPDFLTFFCPSSTWLWTVNWIECKMLWADEISHKETKFSGGQSIKAIRQTCFFFFYLPFRRKMQLNNKLQCRKTSQVCIKGHAFHATCFFNFHFIRCEMMSTGFFFAYSVEAIDIG